MIRAAGLGWVRVDAPFPWRGRIGDLRPEYAAFRARAVELQAAGLRVMGVTPYPRDWQVPQAAEPGSPTFLDAYRQACAFLARDLGPLGPAWQVCNEMNLDLFRRPLDEAQAVAYLQAGAAGLREGDAAAQVGVNMAGFGAAALRMYEALYHGAGGSATLDYAGTDGYFGSWEAGGPEDWPPHLDRLAALTGRPVVVQEFGYSSAGGVMTDEERRSRANPHHAKKWAHAWSPSPGADRATHTPEIQAVYATRCLELFAAHPQVAGVFWYCWSDHERCWQCGAPDCPCETAWGLVTMGEHPKPAYAAYAEAVRGLFARGGAARGG